MIDARYLGPRPSGIGRYCVELVRAMQALRPELRVSLVTKHAADAKAILHEAVVEFDAEVYGPWTSLWLAHKLGPKPADLFHSPFHVLPRGLDVPAVLTMHDVFNFQQNVRSNYGFPVNFFEWGYFLWAIPDSLRRARRVICVSQTTASMLGQRLPWVKPKLRVIPHGVTPVFRPLAASESDARLRALLGDEFEPFVLCIGGLSPNKNHERMLRAFATAFPTPSRRRLVTVSRFGDGRDLTLLAGQLGLAGRHTLLSNASDEDVVTLLNAADYFAFLSIEEGFGIPIIEAMAAGCPVLTSNASCLPEVAGDAAAYADPYDVGDMARQMRRLSQEPAARQELRERGLARAKRFTWQGAAEATLNVYDEALGSD